METYLVYFDETGDDGVNTSSSEAFVLTSVYMPAAVWQTNFNKIKTFRQSLKTKFGFHVTDEIHTKNILTDKEPYRKYKWTDEEKRNIIIKITMAISELDLSVVNVIIDKTRITDKNYKVLERALTYNIQRIENDSIGKWNYLVITDKGRISPMRKTARAIRSFNPIQSKYTGGYLNQPITNLIEDIMEKDSTESYFIQICDFISYFVHLYYKTYIKEQELPNRVGRLIDKKFVGSVVATLKKSGKLNLKASENNPYGFVIYPLQGHKNTT